MLDLEDASPQRGMPARPFKASNQMHLPHRQQPLSGATPASPEVPQKSITSDSPVHTHKEEEAVLQLRMTLLGGH